MKIYTLLDKVKTQELLAAGYLRSRRHPLHRSLVILGYTEKTVWERMWCHETLTCRGLIYDEATEEVIARPFKKFFNYSEPDANAGSLPMGTPVGVSDKADGSLGILFNNPYSERMEVATRGSFDSDQARWATEWLGKKLADPKSPFHGWALSPLLTHLTEIIVPWNRIVVNYGDREDLVLLGAVDVNTGTEYWPGDLENKWPGSLIDVFPHKTLAAAVSAPPRPGAEGLVVHFFDDPDRSKVKLKQEDYVILHKIITGLSDRAVHEWLSSGRSVEEMAAEVPDEFHEWLEKTANTFWVAFDKLYEEAQDVFLRVCSQMAGEAEESLDLPARARAGAEVARSGREGRKDFALRLRGYSASFDMGLAFGLLDEKDISESIWKKLKPVGVRYMANGMQEGEADE